MYYVVVGDKRFWQPTPHDVSLFVRQLLVKQCKLMNSGEGGCSKPVKICKENKVYWQKFLIVDNSPEYCRM